MGKQLYNVFKYGNKKKTLQISLTVDATICNPKPQSLTNFLLKPNECKTYYKIC